MNNIKRLRNEHGLTQAELAKKLNITTSAVGMYETGARKPSYDILIKLATVFDTSIENIIDTNIKQNTGNLAQEKDTFVKLKNIGMDFYQLQYTHPKISNKKVVKEFQTTNPITAERIKIAFEYLLENDYYHVQEMKNVARKLLTTDHSFSNITTEPTESDESQTLVDFIIDLFYKDIPPHSTKEPRVLIDEIFELPKNAPKTILLGKFGVGKSTVIRNFTNLDSTINFPFTDTSRTTSYQAEYVFTSQKHNNKFAVTFMPRKKIEREIEAAIDRAIEAKINHKISVQLSNSTTKKTEHESDKIAQAIYSDPNQIFDIRYLVGKYIRKESKQRTNEQYSKSVSLWDKYISNINSIFHDAVFPENTKSNKELISAQEDFADFEFYYDKYSSYLVDSKSNASSTYNRLKKYLLTSIEESFSRVFKDLEHNASIYNRKIHLDDNNWPIAYSCIIEAYDVSSKFDDFINRFSSRQSSYFGNSLTPIVSELRIELPYKSNLEHHFNEAKMIFIDTIGISHTSEEGSSIDNSTKLNLDSMDAIIIVDDSRTSMQADTINIIKHLATRVRKDKIYLTYTFYDEFSKSEFDDDDDLYIDEQKQEYLHRVQRNRLSAILPGDKASKEIFLDNLAERTFFLKNLDYWKKNNHSTIFSSPIYDLLNQIHWKYQENHTYLDAEKIDFEKPLVVYDYKRLAMIFFNKVIATYKEQQNNIYMNTPPHFKVTEALTRRLYWGETVYRGAATLKPVDDLYSIILDNLYDFISNPQELNFFKRNSYNDTYQEYLIDVLRERVFERIGHFSEELFVSYEAKLVWKELYELYGIGSDYKRRSGLLKEIDNIIPSYEQYINYPNLTHIIDKIQELIESCIKELEDEIHNQHMLRNMIRK